MTSEQIEKSNIAFKNANKILKNGDRISVNCCGGTKKTYVFDFFDGQWIVSKGGTSDIHPVNVYKLNGNNIDFSITKDVKRGDQVGCCYCKNEKTCITRDPKINKAKLGCINYLHWDCDNSN